MELQGTIYKSPNQPVQPTPVWEEPTLVIPPGPRKQSTRMRSLGLALLAIALGGMLGPVLPQLRLESTFWANRLNETAQIKLNPAKPLPPAAPVVFNPLVREDGSLIVPVNTDFGLVVPKIGINAPVIPNVNPTNPGQYQAALLKGVAHASTSYLPNQNGTVYLFSHSTNYDWFVKDLNAVFYLMKNLSPGDFIVVFYRGERYTYRLRETRVVEAGEVSYLLPQRGVRNLILQTCWPPGSIAKRLLLFADLVQEQTTAI